MKPFPQIEPVDGGTRPLWSVMIPAYEAPDYLVKTIRSVLAQDPGPELMQIEVVDDHSPSGALGEVVERAGKGRVAYFRRPSNGGVVANFNTCLERSRGHWVHVLHADDLIVPGFYEKLEPATAIPGLGAAFCRFYWMNESDHWTGISELFADSSQVLLHWIEKIAVTNYIQAPSIVVSRQVYEEIGGFDPRLPHCADWDMWKRIASAYPVWFEPEVLACYRLHSKSDSSRLVRTGANVCDMRRSIKYARDFLPAPVEAKLTSQALRSCSQFALATAEGMFRRGDVSGATAQAKEALETSCSPRLLYRVARMIIADGARCMLSAQRSARS